MADSWGASSEILTAPGEFPDDNSTPDHRQVQATFDMALPPPITIEELKAQLLMRIARLKGELEALRAMVEGL